MTQGTNPLFPGHTGPPSRRNGYIDKALKPHYSPFMIFTAKDLVSNTISQFNLLSNEKPNLIPTGFQRLDKCIGGLGPGECGILAGYTGLGKTTVMLGAILGGNSPCGVISMEETPFSLGGKVMGFMSGIDTLKLRTKRVSKEEVLRAQNNIPSNLFAACPTLGTKDDVIQAVQALAAEGCRMVWLDYLQKVRGHNGARHLEVAETFTGFQRACLAAGVAGMAISQYTRSSTKAMIEEDAKPQIYHLKESGDLENEARLILLASRENDTVYINVGKSSFGAQGLEMVYRLKGGHLE